MKSWNLEWNLEILPEILKSWNPNGNPEISSEISGFRNLVRFLGVFGTPPYSRFSLLDGRDAQWVHLFTWCPLGITPKRLVWAFGIASCGNGSAILPSWTSLAMYSSITSAWWQAEFIFLLDDFSSEIGGNNPPGIPQQYLRGRNGSSFWWGERSGDAAMRKEPGVKGSAKQPFVMHLLRTLWLFVVHFDVSINIEHIPGVHNGGGRYFVM